MSLRLNLKLDFRYTQVLETKIWTPESLMKSLKITQAVVMTSQDESTQYRFVIINTSTFTHLH